jgi:hypothetical protein
MFQNQRTTNSGSLKKSEWKNCQSQLFQKPESSCGFHEELEKKSFVLWPVICFFKKIEIHDIYIYIYIYIYISKPVWFSWRTMLMNPKNHPDNHQGSVPVSNNYPMLVWTVETTVPTCKPTDVWHKINHKRFSQK